MIKRLKKLLSILWYFFMDEDNLFLYLMRIKAEECIEQCNRLEVNRTEELEDLIYHIRAYISIPENLIETSFPEFRGLTIKQIINKYKKNKVSLAEVERYADFLVDIESQRAIEREIIFDNAKVLTFGFKF